jgi:hypothetical protein
MWLVQLTHEGVPEGGLNSNISPNSVDEMWIALWCFFLQTHIVASRLFSCFPNGTQPR